MELYKEILGKILSQEEAHITFPGLQLNANEIIESQCYTALQQIKAIVANDDLSDFECVEAIVCLLEQRGSNGGSNGGSRHDF